MDKRKNTIKKMDISNEKKKKKIKSLVGKCVNCGKPGGTLFEERNGLLKAVCGATPQCNLNINLKRKMYDNIRELEQNNNVKSESLKMNIIKTKLDYLFGLVSSKDEIVDKFNTLKNELAAISESQLIIQKKYGDIISGIHREPLLNDAAIDLANEIDELKKIYQEYLLKPLPAYLTTMVEKYLTVIKPLTEKIRNINYAYYAVEANIEKSESFSSEGVDDKQTVSDEDISREKKSIYTLVAFPYRLDQLEQERK
jgi:hypothetical protein